MVIAEKKKVPAVDKAFSWAVPEELHVPADPLRCRLDFHHQAVVMTLFEGDGVENRIVSAHDVAHALASDLSFGTGLLPPGTIWWQNTRNGPLFALYVDPKPHRLALQEVAGQPPRRFLLPLPGLIFLCSPGRPPWVFAVRRKPTKETDIVYRAPLCNVFADGRTCPGNHIYPNRVADIPESFFVSFFSAAGELRNCSQRFPDNVIRLWESLDGKKKYPLDDLVKHGTVQDLMVMET